MKLSDSQLNVFVSKVLHLGQGKRKAYLAQVDFLIASLERKIEEDTSFKVKGFKKTGSIMKGTVLKPNGDLGVDADIAVFLDISESEKDDVDNLHRIILDLLVAVYPTKKREEFQVQPRTLGIHFNTSGLDVDLVPVIPIPDQDGYALGNKQRVIVSARDDTQIAFDAFALEAFQWKEGEDPVKRLVRFRTHWERNINMPTLVRPKEAK